MDQVVINTKKGKFVLLDVRKVQTTDEYLLFFFYFFQKTFQKVLTNREHGVIMLSNPNDRRH